MFQSFTQPALLRKLSLIRYFSFRKQHDKLALVIIKGKQFQSFHKLTGFCVDLYAVLVSFTCSTTNCIDCGQVDYEVIQLKSSTKASNSYHFFHRLTELQSTICRNSGLLNSLWSLVMKTTASSTKSSLLEGLLQRCVTTFSKQNKSKSRLVTAQSAMNFCCQFEQNSHINQWT